MAFVESIAKKRDGLPLDRDDIFAFSRGAADGSLPDEQLAAMLMAIRIRGMDARETAQLSLAMAASGQMADLSAIDGVKVDKHSTGGVGDATTLICLPIAAACGVPVAKMSGRSLGHTGGTLDKLHSIPGMRTDLSIDDMVRQVKEIGCALAGQSGDLAPADKKLYALRDLTATVDSLPLIASSILSKKIAAGADAILLDVKTGSGALLAEYDDARALAQTMVEIGKHAGRAIVAVVSDMNQPLGDYVGNALEVREAIEILQGRREGRLCDLSLLLAEHMILLARRASDIREAGEMAREAISSGKALELMARWIAAQGGDARVTQDISLLPQAKLVRSVPSPALGRIVKMRCDRIGLAAHALGAGRLRQHDEIDPSVGLLLHKRLGDRVERGEPLCTLYGNAHSDFDTASRMIEEAIEIAAMPMPVPPLVYDVIA